MSEKIKKPVEELVGLSYNYKEILERTEMLQVEPGVWMPIDVLSKEFIEQLKSGDLKRPVLYQNETADSDPNSDLKGENPNEERLAALIAGI